MQKPKIDEKWEVRIKFWPEDDARLMIVKIYYVWASGVIEFKPALCYDGPPIADYQCAQIEWIRKVESYERQGQFLGWHGDR